MQINKFKKISRSKYKVIFDNTEIILYEDIILKYDLLLKKDIDVYDLDKIIEENSFYDAYYLSLNYIDIKMRNKKEIINYLTKKEFDNKYIDYAINKLEEEGLLNEKKYVEAYINDKINLSSDGPYKIRNQLLQLNFNENDIDAYLNTIDQDTWNKKLKHIVEKKKSLMKNKSYYMYINKLKNDLYNLGYDSNLIDELLSNIKYESNSLDNEFNKASRKYKDNNTKIINSLLRKGYTYEEIKIHINK